MCTLSWELNMSGNLPRVARVILFSLVVTACGGRDANIYGCCFGQNVVGNEAYVTVSNVWNEMDALPLADAHCAKYGKLARFSEMENYRAIFDCVAVD
jgi:hypothetical protein